MTAATDGDVVLTAYTDQIPRTGSGVIPRKKVTHGVDCEKSIHEGCGYQHHEGDDSPFYDDGLKYCGRCHTHIE